MFLFDQRGCACREKVSHVMVLGVQGGGGVTCYGSCGLGVGMSRNKCHMILYLGYEGDRCHIITITLYQ